MLSILLNEISNTIITDNSIKNKPNILQNALISKSYGINIILLCNAASFILQILLVNTF
jgi:hypothetical protein